MNERRTWCAHCPGQGAHKMSCAAYKGGYVGPQQPCTERDLRRLHAIREGRVTLPVVRDDG